MKIVDLHVHSTKSDGSFTPAQLVDYAMEKGLSAFALTDHDTTEGLAEAFEAAEGKNIEVIPGIEFSTEYQGKDIHILGLYIDYEGEEFKKYLVDFQNSRTLRNEKMCKKLSEHGVNITYEELQKRFPEAVLTRAHYAKFLWEEGYVSSMKEAFDRYIGDHAPCFLPREKVTPVQAVELILRVKGVPILAHPVLYGMSDERLETLVSTLKEAGLVGIEAVYSTYNNAEERKMKALAKKYDLLISGGSDFHGTTKPGLDLATGYGKLFIPYEILEKIKEYRNIAMKCNILFSDMDGTLLNDKKEISPQVYEAIDKFTKNGGKLVLSSGRPLDSILKTKEKLGLNYPGMYVIAYNGALVYDCQENKPIFEQKLPIDYVNQAMEIAGNKKVHCQTYSDTHIVVEKDTKELQIYREHIHMPYIVVKNAGEYLRTLEIEPYKLIAIELTPEKLEDFRKELTEKMQGKIHAIYSSVKYLEIIHKNASKGNAVKFLCDYLQIPIHQAVAAGDAANDISMLKAAGVGVAMKNATEDTKEAADYITKKTNNEDGILELFENWLI